MSTMAAVPAKGSDIYSEWFLSIPDKRNIATYQCRDRRRKTLTTRLLSPVWCYADRFIPPTVAPNVITLGGFVCTLQVCSCDRAGPVPACMLVRARARPMRSQRGWGRARAV